MNNLSLLKTKEKSHIEEKLKLKEELDNSRI